MSKNVPLQWKDTFFHDEKKIILTRNELDIPGLEIIGWSNTSSAGEVLPLHYHKNCIEIVCNVSGNYFFNAGGKDYKLYGGDIFFTQPDEAHSTNKSTIGSGILLWIQLDVSDRNNFLFLNPIASNKLLNDLNNISEHCIKTDKKMIMQLQRSIISSVRGWPSSCDPYTVASYLVLFLHKLIDFEKAAANKLSDDIIKACNYIEDHLNESILLEDIADHINLSVPHFKYKFRSQMGISPKNYINAKKIEQIKSELKQDSNFTKISEEYEFCNSAYFSVVFKKYTGLTPSEYISLGGK